MKRTQEKFKLFTTDMQLSTCWPKPLHMCQKPLHMCQKQGVGGRVLGCSGVNGCLSVAGKTDALPLNKDKLILHSVLICWHLKDMMIFTNPVIECIKHL